ncbi:Acyl-CoA synthetase (AMP-forming)/AMP-acid ligase II [Shimia gijangensis]|uniref:Acyl-CoA synthetase (AMP-forming)/AMP-acid ligase II n=1 Tax=Shimia gijangensis TaxID=1470563 RepID=A0A1M6NRL0_9RHOB|nr:class I adenylate-forming enzyme family protein [Shimia gijangensis]SHJ98381.1 Acyl-CoA synthetase (AMP-forming)/AMP-acid ligase II [Shimia gijangensis]
MHDQLDTFLRNAAAQKADGLAIIDHDDQRLNWSELWQATQCARDRLQAAGVGPGNRVVLVLENCAEVVAFFFATTMLQASAVAVNARMTQDELHRIVEHSDPSALVFTTSSSQDARNHAKQWSATAEIGIFGEVAIAARSGSTPEPTSPDPAKQVALLLYTSGTTGAPKAAMLTHTNLMAAARASADVRGMRDGDMTYLALPLSHIFGIVTMLAICFAQGSVRLEARFSVERLYAAIQKDVTLLPAVPQMHAHLFEYAQTHGMPKYDKGLLRYVSSGGAPLDPAWKREAEAFYGVALQNGYGLTECGAGVYATRNDFGDPDISVGGPMLGSTLTLDLKAPGAKPEEGIGEILVSGPQVMKGYFRDLEQTKPVLSEDGVFRTGDLGRFDGAGRLHIVGRTKELIIRSGFNVYPVEVEAALTEHPDVTVAAVVGRSVEGNEEVLAFVKAAPNCGLTAEMLRTYLKEHLAPYKRPSHIIVAKELPAAPTGKILKARLIDHFAVELAALER